MQERIEKCNNLTQCSNDENSSLDEVPSVATEQCESPIVARFETIDARGIKREFVRFSGGRVLRVMTEQDMELFHIHHPYDPDL